MRFEEGYSINRMRKNIKIITREWCGKRRTIKHLQKKKINKYYVVVKHEFWPRVGNPVLRRNNNN